MNTPRPLTAAGIAKIEKDARAEIAAKPGNNNARDKLRLIATLRVAEDTGDRLAAKDARAGHGDYLPANAVKRLVAGESPIRIWRKHRGLTLKDLAAAAGCGKSFLSQLENGKKKAGVDTLRALAAALDVDLDDLV